MAKMQGKAPVACQTPIFGEPGQNGCSLCGRVINSQAVKKGYQKAGELFRTHVARYHTLPVVIEYTFQSEGHGHDNGNLAIAWEDPKSATPEYIALGKTSSS